MRHQHKLWDVFDVPPHVAAHGVVWAAIRHGPERARWEISMAECVPRLGAARTRWIAAFWRALVRIAGAAPGDALQASPAVWDAVWRWARYGDRDETLGARRWDAVTQRTAVVVEWTRDDRRLLYLSPVTAVVDPDTGEVLEPSQTSS